MYDIDHHLSRRQIELPSGHFEARIVAAARARKQSAPLNLSAWLNQAFGEWRLPHPQLVFALILMMGLGIGFGAPPLSSHSLISAQPYFSDDGAIL